MTLRHLSILTMVVSLTAPMAALGADWKDVLEAALETSIYTKSDTAALDGNRITREGTALVVKKTGILASPARHLGSVNTKLT